MVPLSVKGIEEGTKILSKKIINNINRLLMKIWLIVI